jgi:hypothetical protein
VFWLRRPPYARWLAALVVVAAAAVIDLGGAPTRPHPYLTAPVAAGETIDANQLQWRDIPVGVLPSVDLEMVVAAQNLGAGEPLLPSCLTDPTAIPPDWWAVPVPIPGNPAPGTSVRIVLTDTLAGVEGIVVTAATQDGFALESTGLAAVPGEHADAVAAAAIDQRLVVLVAP